MLALILAALLAQDPSVEDLVRDLSAEKIEIREKATRALSKIPLDKLPLLEKHLRGPDAEASARVRLAMNQVLDSAMGRRKLRFELREVADPGVMKTWVTGGSDPKNPPRGLEARQLHPKAFTAENGDWLLVGPVMFTEREVADASSEVDMQAIEMWHVRFDLVSSAAKRFDEVAAVMYAKEPRGKLAILLDNRVLGAPQVQCTRFDSRAVISGNFTEQVANDIARALKGDWLESSFRAEREGGSKAEPEKVADFLRGVKGLEKASMQPDASGLDVSGLLDTKEVDLVSVWQSLRERGYRLTPKK